MKTTTTTAEELRKAFFDNDLYGVLDGKKLSNREIRRKLFHMNDNTKLKYKQEGTYIVIWTT